MMAAAEYYGLKAANPSAIAAFLIGLGLVTVATLLAIYHIISNRESSQMPHLVTALFYFGLAMAMLYVIIGFASLSGILSFGCVLILTYLWGYGDCFRETWAILGQVMKWTKLTVVLLLILFLVLAGVHFAFWRL